MVQWVEFDDGWRCDFSWVPMSMPEYIDGSVGRCGLGESMEGGFTVWYGEYGEHKVPQTTATPPPSAPVPAPAPAPAPGDCTRDQSDFRNGGFGEYSRELSCQEMLNQWDAFLADTSMVQTPVNGWLCYPPSAGDYGGCSNRDQGMNFSVHPASGGAPNDGSGSGDGGDTGAADLGLSTPMTRPACDGMGIVVLFSATTPGLYEAEVQQALNDHPGSSYLRTDQTCSSLNQSYEGNPIYAVYQAAGYELEGLCQAAGSLGGYARWLNNTADPNTDPC